MKPACRMHDRVNLWALPIIGCLAVAGILDIYDRTKVTNAFLMYIVADFVWVWVEPDAVPSKAGVILMHHFVTFLLLLFPLRYPSFALYTCLDGVTEINTFFMIARRQWRQWGQPLNRLYWTTFIPLRLVLYPYLLVKFWFVLSEHSLVERCGVCACQLFLCCFNLMMLYASIQRRLRNDSSVSDLWSMGKRQQGAELKAKAGPQLKIRAEAS